jgi:hypothetical protein
VFSCGSDNTAAVPHTGVGRSSLYYSNGSKTLVTDTQAVYAASNSAAAAAGDLAQQMYQMQMGDAAAAGQPLLSAGLCAATTSQLMASQPPRLTSQQAILQQQQQLQRQQRRRYSCPLPLQREQQYGMLGGVSSISSFGSPLEPVLEETHMTAMQQRDMTAMQEERLVLADIELELQQLLQVRHSSDIYVAVLRAVITSEGLRPSDSKLPPTSAVATHVSGLHTAICMSFKRCSSCAAARSV